MLAGGGAVAPSDGERDRMTGRRVLVLVPHPDDEVVGCAAAITRGRRDGVEFSALYLTTGVPPREALWPWQRRHYARRVERRRAEALAAAAQLDIRVVGFSDRPSRRLKHDLGEALAAIGAAIVRSGAETLWVPAWEGGHQDHDVANFLGSRLAGSVAVSEYALYNFAGGGIRSQRFPETRGTETVLRLDARERARKRALLALYRSERGNLAHVETEVESMRSLPRHDYTRPPHPGTLFAERFHWVPIPHPRVDFEPAARIREAFARFTS